MEKVSKKELKIVLSAELYDELRFVFRPDQLENIIYKPDMLSEKKWQCCCGSESELEICPICGMEKHTVFSKVNAGYLAHHRKARIARKRKAVQDQQAMMAAQIIKKNKNSKKKDKEKSKKLATLISVLILCIAVILSIAIIFGGGNTSKPDDTKLYTSDSQSTPEQTDDAVPEYTEDDTTVDQPDTTETTPVETAPPETEPPEPVVVPTEAINKNPTTIKDGKWPSGASGNVSVGGLVYSAEEYDYIAKDGIKILDKNGAEVGTLTTNAATCITGNGSYVFYVDIANDVHRVNTETNQDVTFKFKAKKIIAYYDELYYTSPDENGLFACSLDGYKTKIVSNLEIFALNCTADKLYFSTSESLAVITSKDGPVSTFCKDGARATSIFEITNCLFYTATDGKLKFFNPAKRTGYSVEYPIYNANIAHVVAYENRVYIKAVKSNGAVTWYTTTWTPGTKLFNPKVMRAVGISTDALYVSNNAIYDGNLNRKPVS